MPSSFGVKKCWARHLLLRDLLAWYIYTWSYIYKLFFMCTSGYIAGFRSMRLWKACREEGSALSAMGGRGGGAGSGGKRSTSNINYGILPCSFSFVGMLHRSDSCHPRLECSSTGFNVDRPDRSTPREENHGREEINLIPIHALFHAFYLEIFVLLSGFSVPLHIIILRTYRKIRKVRNASLGRSP